MATITGDSSSDTTQINVCNLALKRLGAKTIAVISESTKNAEHCNMFWNYVLDEVLSDHAWNFMKKSVALDYTAGFGVYSTDDVKTITGISQASPAVVTCVGHGFVTGNTVYIYDVAGMTEVNEAVYPVTLATVDTFNLTGFDSTKWTAYTSGGSCYRKESESKYSSGYTYDIPADFLKALHISGGSTEFEIFGNGTNRRLLTTMSDPILTYVSLEATTADMLTLTRFINVFAWRLAAELAVPLSKKGAKQEWAMGMYNYSLGKLSTTDARSEKVNLDQSDSWLTAGDFTV